MGLQCAAQNSSVHRHIRFDSGQVDGMNARGCLNSDFLKRIESGKDLVQLVHAKFARHWPHEVRSATK